MKFTAPRLRALIAAILVLFATTHPASAYGHRWRRTPPPPKPVYTAITAVDRSAMTVTTAPKNSTGTTPKTYRINADTKIDVDGKPGTLADLQSGQRVRVGLGADADLAAELSITKPPGAAGKPKPGRGKHHRF